MQWEQIAHLDPFLAGALAARERLSNERGASREADSVGLFGEAKQKFIAGWDFEIAEQEQERLARRLDQEREALLDEVEEKVSKRGDPTMW